MAFLERARLDVKQVKDCLRDLQRLPPMRSLAETVDLGERFMFLDSTLFVARGGIEALEGLGAAGKRPKRPAGKDPLEDIDWDPALTAGNAMYDRLVAAMRLPDRASRAKAFRKIEADIKATFFSPDTKANGIGWMTKAGWENTIKTLVDQGAMKQSIDASTAFNGKFVAASGALKR